MHAVLADAVTIGLAVDGLIAVGFLGWLLPSVFFKSRQPKKLMCYAHRVLPFSQSDPKTFEDLSVRYADRELICPVRYTLYVWNCGDVTITGSDLAKADPFGFGRNDLDVLDTMPVWSTHDGVNARCRIDSARNKLLFEFDVLAPYDGFAVEFLADFSAAKRRRKFDLKSCGTVKGLSRPPRNAQGAYDRAKRWQGSLALAGLAICLLSTTLMAYDAWNSGFNLLGAVKLLAALLFAAAAVVMGGLLLSVRDKSTTIKVPRLLYRSQHSPIETGAGA
jgi:hypothetical protein